MSATSSADTPCHRMPLRVYYEDTDAGGIVYYANYLKFAERARTELLRELGFENSTILEQKGIALAVRRVSAEYLKPARLDDALSVETRVTSVKGATVDMAQVVRRDGEDLVQMNLTLACMNMDGRPVRLPAEVRTEMSRFAGPADGTP
ncbi:MAG: tol-pal system-associated acyl-CoA thioesterase [Rhodospirillales bacterium]